MGIVGVEEGSGSRVNETKKKKKSPQNSYPPPRKGK